MTTLDLEAMEALDNLPLDQRLILDLERGVKVVIGFAERHHPGIANTLRQFIQQHPQFSFLIQPILDSDPKWASSGEILFWLEGKIVRAILYIRPPYIHQESKEIHLVLSLDDFRQFVQLTELFGLFMTDGGDTALNFG